MTERIIYFQSNLAIPVMRAKASLILVLFFVLARPLAALSQDFTGLWTGFMNVSGNQLPYEMAISEAGNKLHGYSLTVFKFNDVENLGIKSLKLKTRKDELSAEDDELVYDNYTTAARRVTMFSRLTLSREDSLWVLEGSFFTRSSDRSTFRGSIRLVKKQVFTDSRLMAQLNKMNLGTNLSFVNPSPIKEETSTASITKTDTNLQAASKLPVEEKAREEIKFKQVNQSELVSLPTTQKSLPPGSLPVVKVSGPSVKIIKAAAEIDIRKTEIIRNISFTSDSLVLTLYDNGEVDGDTVSVVANDKLIIARQRLGISPIQTTIHIPPGSGDSIRLVMYAENLGRIPPNTGVLIIMDGTERHQVRFEGDLQKNAAVILHRKH